MPRTATAAASRSDEGAKLSSTERAYRDLKRLILDNALPAGSQLLEQEGALRLGMSRTPVREAMIRLAREGMVEIRPRHGMRVLPIAAADMREIYAILGALEAEAARAIAEKGAQPADLARMRDAVAEMDKALATDDRIAWARADARFHRALTDASGNRRLIDLVGQFWDQVHRARMATLMLRPKPVQSNLDHEALIAAIAARQPDRAHEIHRRHLMRSREMLIGLIERMNLQAL